MDEENKGATLTPNEAEKEETSTPDVKTKTFTQEEINSLIAERANRAKESAIKEVLKEAGFDSKESLKEYLEKSKNELSNYKFVDACNENKISADRFDDVKALLKGKGLEINSENIKSVAESHPEWIRAKREPALKAQPIGSTHKNVKDDLKSEYEKGKSYFPSLNKIGG